MSKNYDVIVVGLGSIGSMALWQTAKTGASVLGLEQFGRIHAEGAYTGESRLFRVIAKEGALFTPALLKARELWQELEGKQGRPLLLPVGVLHIAPGDHEDIAASMKAVREYDLAFELLEADQLRARYPQFRIEDTDVGLLDPLGGGSRPEAAVLSAQEEALQLGATIQDNVEVVAIERHGDGVLVRTAAGEEFHAGRVIIAAGPWSTRLVPELREVVTVGNYGLVWMVPQDVSQFDPAILPAFMRDLGDAHVFGVPTLDGFSIKIAPHILLPDVADMADFPREFGRDNLRLAGEIARGMMPGLVGEPSRWSIHPDSATARKIPIIDTTLDGRVAYVSGLCGNGFKFAPTWGLALAELATTGTSQWQHAEFTLDAHLAAR